METQYLVWMFVVLAVFIVGTGLGVLAKVLLWDMWLGAVHDEDELWDHCFGEEWPD